MIYKSQLKQIILEELLREGMPTSGDSSDTWEDTTTGKERLPSITGKSWEELEQEELEDEEIERENQEELDIYDRLQQAFDPDALEGQMARDEDKKYQLDPDTGPAFWDNIFGPPPQPRGTDKTDEWPEETVADPGVYNPKKEFGVDYDFKLDTDVIPMVDHNQKPLMMRASYGKLTRQVGTGYRLPPHVHVEQDFSGKLIGLYNEQTDQSFPFPKRSLRNYTRGVQFYNPATGQNVYTVLPY